MKNRISRHALPNIIMAALLLTSAVRSAQADPPPASPKAPSSLVIVPTGLSDAAAFSMDWTFSIHTSKPGFRLRVYRGHTDVRRRATGGSGADSVAYRGEMSSLVDATGTFVAKPASITAVYCGRQGVVYNAAHNMYVRKSFETATVYPSHMSPWGDMNDMPISLALGMLALGTNSAPEDGTYKGVPVNIYVQRSKPQSYTRDGVQHIGYSETRSYYAKETNMPLGFGTFVCEDGIAPKLSSEMDISACKPLPSLPDDRFVLNIPKTATEWVPKQEELLASGTPAPDFTCIGANGLPVKLSDLKGRIVILDFWATWCVPCQASMPHLEHVYRQVKDANVTVLALCVHDEQGTYEKWRIRHKTDYSFPVAFDPAGVDRAKPSPYTAYKISGIPTQYIIDKNGDISGSIVGSADGSHNSELEAELAKLGVIVPVDAKTAAK